MPADLEVKNLVKQYGSFRAVGGISFEVPKGKIVGFLGPNGAGKTTTIQMLMGITLASAGTIRYFGRDFSTNRQWCLQKINFTSAFNTLVGRITPWENLMVFALLYGIRDPQRKIRTLADYFEISEVMNQRYFDLSAGQKTRVNLAKAFLNDPELILMDEPTASLDPDIADKTLTLIEDLKRTNHISILYTSHDMNEITRICDEVIFLDHGEIVAQDTPMGLTKRINWAEIRLTYANTRSEVEPIMMKSGYEHTFEKSHRVSIRTTEKQIPAVIFGISNAGVDIIDIEIQKPTLEDVFLQIARRA